MGRPVVLVTVTREDGRSRDLVVAADLPCADLIHPLRAAFGAGPEADTSDPSDPEFLHDRDGRRLRAQQTLADAGVLHGDRLHLGSAPGAPGARDAAGMPAPLDQAEAVRRRFGPAAP